MNLVKIDSNNEGKAWQQFPGSEIQKSLHNDLVKRIEQGRTALEGVSPEELARMQGELRAYRNLLTFIHSKDSKEIKEIYVDENPART